MTISNEQPGDCPCLSNEEQALKSYMAYLQLCESIWPEVSIELMTKAFQGNSSISESIIQSN
ncbi:MAG: hypothetical protein AAF327_08070 [Cyanobacteria bacterium P01_A01_bin.37]